MVWSGHFSKDGRRKEIKVTGFVQVGLMLGFSEEKTALSATSQGPELAIFLLTALRKNEM